MTRRKMQYFIFLMSTKVGKKKIINTYQNYLQKIIYRVNSVQYVRPQNNIHINTHSHTDVI